ncbi:MAG TPA: outer membrane beta-barrel protein [Pirellulaceae bacterium]|nr:outer membrane beta-barrel protein [Pirellulaceae bacterium]HMO93876.1 outer membrane beta-barrel protein [Pirellulaceae bacterium]HMP67716.1 outer membrane beta-barrel protein [Pirellulaceae bacterium]
MLTKVSLAVIALLMTTTTAFAQRDDFASGTSFFSEDDYSEIAYLGPYIRVLGGWNFLTDIQTVNSNAASILERTGIDFRDGWAAGGSIGGYVNHALRSELEFSYRNNSADQIVDIINGNQSLNKKLNSYSALGNLIYDMDGLKTLGVTPYIGGGIGASYLRGNLQEEAANHKISDIVLAYQGLAGLHYEIAAGTRFFTEYRYFGTTNFGIKGPVTTIKDNSAAHNVFFGIQFDY